MRDIVSMVPGVIYHPDNQPDFKQLYEKPILNCIQNMVNIRKYCNKEFTKFSELNSLSAYYINSYFKVVK